MVRAYTVVVFREAAVVDILNGRPDEIIRGRRMSFGELPWPDRKLIKNERNIEVAYNDTGKRITSFQSARACPFGCKYCADGHMGTVYDSRFAIVERRPVNDLVAEMIYVGI